MVYYKDEKLSIRSMVPEDAKVYFDTYMSYGWHPQIETYENYYKEQENGERMVFVAEYEGKVCGKLLDVAEAEAVKISDTVFLAVGCHSGYGAAQRIYVKRGYIPDGSGVWYQGKQLEQYAPCVNDDDLLLFMSKKLS